MADTSVTAQTIVDNSVSRRKDVDKTNWGDSELLAYLNKAIDNIGMMLIYLESELAITEGAITPTATQQFTLSGNLDNFWAMSREGVYFLAVETPLTPVVYGAKIRNKSTETATYPTSFYVTSTALGLIPVPASGATCISASALKCRYFARPTTLTLASTMPYKNVFNESASLFMDSVAALRDDMDMAAYQEARNVLESLVLKVVKYRNPIGPKALPEKG